MEKDSEMPMADLQKLFGPDEGKNKENSDERELARLLEMLPPETPSPGTLAFGVYKGTQQQIEALKQRVAKKHRDLMDVLRQEESVGQEIREKNKNEETVSGKKQF